MIEYFRKHWYVLLPIKFVDLFLIAFFRKKIFSCWSSEEKIMEIFSFQLTANAIGRKGWNYLCQSRFLDIRDHEKGMIYLVFSKTVGPLEAMYYSRLVKKSTDETLAKLQTIVTALKAATNKNNDDTGKTIEDLSSIFKKLVE